MVADQRRHPYADRVELAKLSRDEVSIAYNIPPPVLGIMDRPIKSNVSEGVATRWMMFGELPRRRRRGA